ncbi:hypothetical protein FAUST_9142 [Fusarium austroamericanum]|uniref:NACHT domain-containing protein n=1 Tax=Fusarium austroamericanum TaxID=282268 RepID=A0AAN6BWG8_FUSAU|nr:hypothetical protein FAUST_9142 [Fusarium austroamericanum]
MPLQHNVSALAKSTIKIAYDELYRTINTDDKRNFANISLQDVRDAALKIENQLAARQSLRNMRRLMPLFRGLEQYSKMVDILCNGTPFLPWIWAPITLILRISSEYVEAFEQIIKGYASIAESLKRFEILSDALINEPDFQQTVAVFYADILKFHKYAYKFVRRSGWTLIFSASWGRFERRFGNILEDLKHHGALIDLEASAHNISQSKKMRDDIRRWREESENRVRREDNEHTAKQYGSIVSWLKVNDADQLAIVDSISSEVEKYQGTCGWILQNKRIRSWADTKPSTPALWLKGSAGTGKSVLCTQLINFLKETKFVIWHFCTYLYATSTMYEQIMKSLLLQILRKDADLVAYVYKTCVMEMKPPTTTVLEQLLQKLLGSMSTEPNQVEYVWVIIDGLDECESDKQLRLVRLINQLTSKPAVPGSTACKVLLSSRGPSTPLERLIRKQVVSLSEEKSGLNVAVRQYVDQRLTSMDTKLRQLNLQHANIVEIQEAIVTKADGMFLYARLVMDYLSSNIFFGGHEMKESVNQLPKKLSDFSGNHEISGLVPEYVIDTVGTLIEERRDSTMAFIHNSVKEFLQTSSQPILLRQEQAFQEHGVATIACLLSGLKVFDDAYPERDRVLRVAKGLHGIHVYATEFWTEYLLHCISSNNTDTVGSSKSLTSLACELADELERGGMTNMAGESITQPIDDRLESLQRYPVLQKHVDRSLRSRSLESLQSRILGDYDNEGETTTQLVYNKIERLLASYQELVKFLLSQSYYPGLSPDELESFIINFGTAVYTCRLTSCSYATVGFNTIEHLIEHELEHTRRFQCAVPGCQYPPSVSKSALESHMKRDHTPVTTSKPVLRHALASKRNSSNRFEAPSRETFTNREQTQTLVKAQMNRTGQTPQQLANETMARLKALGKEEQRISMQEVMNDIPMSQEEHDEMAAKLTKIVVDMTKIGYGLTKWYNITRDDTCAKLFFRMRWRILKQFADGEKMSILKNSFSIDSAEIAEARAMLEGMAKDLAANMIRATPQAQNAQLAQQPIPQQQQQPQPRQQPVPVPENARRGSQQNSIPKGGNKGSQAPPAPTTTQAPQAGKKTSPDVRRVSETQVAYRPVLTCKEPECEFSTTGYSTEQALQQHILKEHIKPQEVPLKFIQENLALALGLEPDGSAKKAEAASMSITNSKQGQTPITTVATTMFTDGNMERSASSMGKP